MNKKPKTCHVCGVRIPPLKGASDKDGWLHTGCIAKKIERDDDDQKRS